MAQNLIGLEEAAKMLGIDADELNRLREKREVFGVRDGNAWKFKPEEIERYKQSLAGGSSSAIGLGMGQEADQEDDVPAAVVGDEGDDDASGADDDVVLLSEEELGSSIGAGSTIIGGSPKAGQARDESDIHLSGDSEVDLGASDSGVALVANTNGTSDSDVKLVASDSDLAKSEGGSSGGSELDLVDLGDDSSGMAMAADSEVSPTANSSVDISAGSELTLGSSGSLDETDPATGSSQGNEVEASSQVGSDLALGGEDDELYALAPDESAVGAGGPVDSSSLSAVDSGGQFDDDDIVLGGSSPSGLGDSGINLEAADDSGLSLEEPFELSDEMSSGSMSSEVEELESDDDFLLTPMLELDDQESDSSGSQVIALDSEEQPFDQDAATLMGEDVPAMDQLDAGPGLTTGGAQPAMAPGVGPAPSVPEPQFSIWNVLSLLLVFIVVGFTGMMMFEMVRNMWSWGQPYEVSASIMDSVIQMFEGG